MSKFPSPLEVNGVSNRKASEGIVPRQKVSVPSREETGVSNMMMLLISFKLSNVSVPSRGDWGFLL